MLNINESGKNALESILGGDVAPQTAMVSDQQVSNNSQSGELTEIKAERKPQDQLLIDEVIKLGVTFFADELSDPYAVIPVNGHTEIWRINSKLFERWLGNIYYTTYKRAIKSESIKQVKNVFSGMAIYDGEKRNLHNRVANSEDSIFYDLTNEAWQCVEVTKEKWEVAAKPPILFKRYSHHIKQITPLPGGNINDIFNYVTISEDQKTLFLVYLVSCFVPDISHPVNMIFGEKGASKTTTAKILKKLIDPSQIEAMSFPKDNKELIQNLSHHWYLNFDNLSNLSDNQSDALCRAVTGEANSKRALYTDDEDVIYKFKRCICLNGIDCVATRDDLLDRSILTGIERISDENRKTEAELWQDFEQDRPYILGAIFEALSKAMSIYSTVKIDKLARLADFHKWGYAIAEALGSKGEEFSTQYWANIDRQSSEVTNTNPVAILTMALMTENENWSGTPTQLYTKLKEFAIDENINTRDKTFPKSPAMLTKSINKIKSNLQQYGITYVHDRASRGSKITFSCSSISSKNNLHDLHSLHSASETEELASVN